MRFIFQIAIVVILISVAVGVSILLLNYQRSEPDQVLNITHFDGLEGDVSEFKGLTLPFRVGKSYQMYHSPRFERTIDFAVPKNTEVIASLPGKVFRIDQVDNTTEIRVSYSPSIYLVYVVGKDAKTDSQLPQINSTLKRGDKITVTDGNIYGNTTLSVTITGPETMNFTQDNYWASGEPKYFR